MQITVTGNKIDVGDALRGHIEDSLSSAVEKYFGDAIEADVVLSREGRKFRADISVHVGRGIYARAHECVDDPYAAFDIAAAHVAKRLRRYKRRIRNHHGHENGAADIAQMAQQYVLAAETPAVEDDEETPADDNPVVIAETAMRIESLSVSEAVMRMDLEDLAALMFRNAKSGELNVVYRRADGNIGWIDPHAVADG